MSTLPDRAARQRAIEMEAGRRAVMRARLSTAIYKLKLAGMDTTVFTTDDEILAALALAEYANAIPNVKTYVCTICGEIHMAGERCPNSARKFMQKAP